MATDLITEDFDPFGDRTARDIRNSLSSALVAVLCGTEPGRLASVVRYWMAQHIGPSYRAYIQQRYEVYKRLITEIRTGGIENVRFQAVVMWNAGLFFELHELLETVWVDAKEPERTALKGFIQAAGVYVHARRGKHAAARGLAARARHHLAETGLALDFISNLDELLAALEAPGIQAPILMLNLPLRSE